MKLLIKIASVLLALLSVAAGIPKVMGMQQEFDFLQAIGVSGFAVLILGIAQILGGLLLLSPKTRFTGAALVVLGFLISCIALFVGGNLSMALVSVIPLAVALALMLKFYPKQKDIARD